MIRTIKQRIYLIGLLPIAALAIALVMFNGMSRIDDAEKQLAEERRVTKELLTRPAVEALSIGNTLYFGQIVKDIVTSSKTITCVSLMDEQRTTVEQAGNCSELAGPDDLTLIEVPSDGLSDYPAEDVTRSVIGELRLSMNDDTLTIHRQTIILQLVFSTALIAFVSLFIGRLLRKRLIQPLQRIDTAMHAVSNRNYQTSVDVEGEDELAHLARAINQTIRQIEDYTQELENRRDDANRALHDADEAIMARDALVRSLTEDLEGPMGLMHSELTATAIANDDPRLRDRIKSVMVLLQEAQANFSDLIEIATSVQRVSPHGRDRDLADIMMDMQRDIRALTTKEQFEVNFVVTQTPLGEALTGEPTGIIIDIDTERFKKALVHIIRAIGRRCKSNGVYVNAELIRIDDKRLNVSVNLKAFYDPQATNPAIKLLDGPARYSDVPPVLMRWTDREAKIIDYLLRTNRVTPTYSASPAGTVNVVLDATCEFSLENEGRQIATDWMFGERPVSTVLVTNDLTMARLKKREDMSIYEFQLVSFRAALADSETLLDGDVLLIDISDDISAAVSLLDQLKNNGPELPHLIAICPPGRMSDALGDRLFELGFSGLIQKPLQSGRVIEVLRTTISNPLETIGRDSPKSR